MQVRLVLSTYLLLLTIVHLSCGQKGVPEVKLQALSPKGFRAYIEDVPDISLFVFQGNLNRSIGNSDIGTISGEVLQATDGKWVFEDPKIQLKVGDVINYYVFVSINRAGYLKDNLTFVVKKLEDAVNPGTNTRMPICEPTVTKVRGGTACSNEIIFEDTFETLKENIWQIEQYLPIYHNELPFVSYQRVNTDPTVTVVNGNLRIAPTLQQNQPGFNNESIFMGSLNLFKGCTSIAEACHREASGADILYPVVSGRITNKGFAFTYGTVHVRAKLPRGDWLYPEILLEPFLSKYGSMRYASGVIKIATARGNRELNAGPTDYGNQVLYGGPIMDFDCRETLLSSKLMPNGKQWGEDFHVYSVRWEPERITLSVDGVEWARVEPSASGLRGRFPQHCEHLPRSLLGMGTSLAPFNDHFYITLGLAAGGITEFRDGVHTSGGRPKPWRNQARKALLNFWEDTAAWWPTWNQAELLIDYVRVVAL